MNRSTTIKLKNIEKHFGSERVLKAITIDFIKGKSYALVGSSGSGKSTLLHIIAGFDVPSSGTTNVSLNNKTHSFGSVFQSPCLIKELSVIENVVLPSTLLGASEEEARKKAKELLSLVGLSEMEEWNVGQLSGGQQQRVSLVRALINKPDFLLADEPTGSLDNETSKEIIAVIVSCQKKWGMGIIVTSHDSNVADAMDEVLRLENGMICKKG